MLAAAQPTRACQARWDRHDLHRRAIIDDGRSAIATPAAGVLNGLTLDLQAAPGMAS